MATFVVPDTPEMRYVRAYNATVHSLTTAAAKFDVISQDGETAAVRNEARAKSLEALLELQLAKDQHDAIMLGQTSINPPSAEQVAHTIAIAAALAEIAASEKKFAAILGLFKAAVDAIGEIHNAGGEAATPAPAPSPTPGP
jgi:hypothetical protein